MSISERRIPSGASTRRPSFEEPVFTGWIPKASRKTASSLNTPLVSGKSSKAASPPFSSTQAISLSDLSLSSIDTSSLETHDIPELSEPLDTQRQKDTKSASIPKTQLPQFLETQELSRTKGDPQSQLPGHPSHAASYSGYPTQIDPTPRSQASGGKQSDFKKQRRRGKDAKKPDEKRGESETHQRSPHPPSEAHGPSGFEDAYLEDSEYKYKTAICRSHLATGYCEYGSACQYAHGVQELRPRDFDVKFKTELCKNYHAMGMCWFGSRCRFIHDEYRIQAGENEFWLVAPSENLVRVEIVDPENTARKKLLQSLVCLSPLCFPKPWEMSQNPTMERPHGGKQEEHSQFLQHQLRSLFVGVSMDPRAAAHMTSSSSTWMPPQSQGSFHPLTGQFEMDPSGTQSPSYQGMGAPPMLLDPRERPSFSQASRFRGGPSKSRRGRRSRRQTPEKSQIGARTQGRASLPGETPPDSKPGSPLGVSRLPLKEELGAYTPMFLSPEKPISRSSEQLISTPGAFETPPSFRRQLEPRETPSIGAQVLTPEVKGRFPRELREDRHRTRLKATFKFEKR